MSKRELERYAPKKTKTGRSPANAGDLAALHTVYRKSMPLNYIASEGVFYRGGRGFVWQIIEPVTFARCAFISEYRIGRIFRYM